MKAQIGDRLILAGTHVGDPQRSGVVLEVHGRDGAPPYLVRWEDSGHQTLCFPGPDAQVQPAVGPAQGL
jgi:Domain of unknown function (DUF1918)